MLLWSVNLLGSVYAQRRQPGTTRKIELSPGEQPSSFSSLFVDFEIFTPPTADERRLRILAVILIGQRERRKHFIQAAVISSAENLCRTSNGTSMLLEHQSVVRLHFSILRNSNVKMS
ncbi:hypothetical protein T12_3253 [Trichinella patagoniensis]|uniref:Uncharacterized protein n=1 Tax=Trichinella patagoniensis TaxID=990121 RepID=A0A0V1ABN9_9BILA|nr:hypothetical protein T12_3253 [Trichinella patagoniensis]